MADNNADLLGEAAADTAPSGGAAPGGAVDAVNASLREGDDKAITEQEETAVRDLSQEYTTAREFDRPARAGFAVDRRYAAGLQDVRWASDANIVGSFIDILVSFVYAQNPDLNILASEQVGTQPDKNATDFADTAELIVARQWRDAKLKRTGKKIVKSGFTCGQGWFKALMLTDDPPQPQLEAQIRDQQALLDSLNAMKDGLESGEGTETVEQKRYEIELAITGLQAKREQKIKTGLVTDFIRAEDFQCSLDVANVMDYLEADWCSNDMYILKASAKARFPRLTDEDIKQASCFYQKPAGSKDQNQETASQQGDSMAEGAFTKSAPAGQAGNSKPVEFLKCVELWDHRDAMIKTFIDGVKKWAIEPYAPKQATSRFYPYFGLAFYEVDGMRHPQSLVFRLRKLADEYAACRSNQRLNRERSVPGTVFNRGGLSVEDATKIEQSVSMENIGLLPTDSNAPLQNLIIAKPIGSYNAALYDTTPILSDMQTVSGVQEALQGAASQGQPKTATEATLEQTGFNSRTGSDRDALEDLLTDLAQYTVETGIQEIRPGQAQRIAGKMAFWPVGMDVDDILTMVEVQIQTGTTGKPDKMAMQQAWSTILPMLKEMMVQIRQVQTIDPAFAVSLQNLVRETLKRLDDRLDLSEFMTTTPPPPPIHPPPLPPVPKVNINLAGMLPPQDVETIVGAEERQFVPPGTTPGAPPNGAPPSAIPPQMAGAIPPQIPGTAVPMPPLHAK